MVGSMRRQKSMKLKPLFHLNKIIGRQPTENLALNRNSFAWSTKKSLKKERRNDAWIIKEAHQYYISGRGKSEIMAEKANKSHIFTRRIAHPAFETLLFGLQQFVACATIQDLNFRSFVAVTVMIVAVALFAILFRNLKLWKWLAMNQFKAKRHEHDEEISGKKWTWIEHLVPDASDDLYISIFIVVGLGVLCGILVLIRRFNSKNVRK